MIKKLLRLGAISACEGLHIKNCIKTGWFFQYLGYYIPVYVSLRQPQVYRAHGRWYCFVFR